MNVYILESINTGRYYIGCSKDVNKRLQKHNLGHIPATKNFRPFKLVFQEKFSNLSEARKIETKLKKLKRRDYIAKIIRSGEIKFRKI